MLQLMTNFGASTSGIGALGVSGSAFLIQLLTFILAYFVLRRYAFKPITKILNERREKIEQGVLLGEQMQKEKAELDKKVTAALHKARKDADGIISEAQNAARETVRAAEDSARQKADGIVKDAEARAEQDAARLFRSVEKQIVSLVADASGAVIDEKLDSAKDTQLIEKAIREQQVA